MSTRVRVRRQRRRSGWTAAEGLPLDPRNRQMSRVTQWVIDLIKSPGLDNPREPERWNPRLKLVRETLLTREREVAELPPALRLSTHLAAHSAAVSRRGTTVLHYRF